MHKINERESYTAVRRRKKITLREIAEYIGCSVSLISQYENGSNRILPDKVRKYKRYIEDYKN
ncbi:helix-turn-helix domain-containing protein [Paenibacillus bouchesdurhonensis]|uniref:helix-turn-helix domain-containing protein n=1 Tax=Paenibacillus bouchesdurhonensis TaxID=1870990 RepID=UPI001F402C10|nr:helix-turn-helix transcriptional regulator [Paenibacillus bouchesdurhonensis]